jgi:hypothetical protein
MRQSPKQIHVQEVWCGCDRTLVPSLTRPRPSHGFWTRRIKGTLCLSANTARQILRPKQTFVTDFYQDKAKSTLTLAIPRASHRATPFQCRVTIERNVGGLACTGCNCKSPAGFQGTSCASRSSLPGSLSRPLGPRPALPAHTPAGKRGAGNLPNPKAR